MHSARVCGRPSDPFDASITGTIWRPIVARHLHESVDSKKSQLLFDPARPSAAPGDAAGACAIM
jgi:hypothetical protein